MTQTYIDNLIETALQALSRGRPELAFEPLELCLAHDKNHAQAWFFLGAAHDQIGQLAQAEQAFAEASRLDPRHPQAANAHATILVRLGKTEAALNAFTRAMTIALDDPQILTNIGIALEALGRHQEALAAYSEALILEPDHLGALNNRGALLSLLNLKEEALKDHEHFVRLAPEMLSGHYFSGETYLGLHRDTEALAAFDEALAIDPQHVKCLFSRTIALSALRRWEEADKAFARGLQTDQDGFSKLLAIGADMRIWNDGMPDPRNLYCLRQQDRLRQCNWMRYDEYVATLRELLAFWESAPNHFCDHAIGHMSLGLPLTSKEQSALASHIARGIEQRHQLHPMPAPMTQSDKSITTVRRLRIGYVSPDFREHATAHLTRLMYGLHDRSQFTIYGYALYTEAKSAAIQHEIAAGCDIFRELSEATNEEIDALIRADEIDILIDLAGYTAHTRPALFPARPAPVCAAYLGYAGSVGLQGVDYYISDAIACGPEQAQFFTEKVVTMPRASFVYNEKQTIAKPLSRAEYGLPEHGFVFCCLNNSWKIDPSVFDSWMRILRRLPDSVLWLYRPAPEVEHNLRAEAEKRCIDPKRLVFAPPLPIDQHLARYQVADLFIDTHYYGGHTTSLDALWAGLPTITRPGETYSSRVSASHWTALGITELITHSESAYEELAVALATDPLRLQQLRTKVAKQRAETTLFDTTDLVRNLERAYLAIWQRHQAGLPPVSMTLK